MSFDLILDFMSLSPENLSFWHKNSKLYAYHVKCSSLIRFLGLFCLRFVRRLQGNLPLSFFSRWDKIYYSS